MERMAVDCIHEVVAANLVEYVAGSAGQAAPVELFRLSYDPKVVFEPDEIREAPACRIRLHP